jgi:hypothetical protein
MKGTKLPSRHFIERKSVAVLCPCPRSLVLAHLLLIDDTLRAIDLPAARRSHALTDFDPLGLGESLEDWEERQEKTRIQPHADARARAVAEGRPTSGRAASVEQRDPALGIPGPLAHHLGLVQEGNPTGDNKIFQGPTRSGRVAGQGTTVGVPVHPRWRSPRDGNHAREVARSGSINFGTR